ncbi:unnamed protein product [Closterium sp. NIES-53]
MTLTPLPTPIAVAVADPTSGPVTACYTTTLPCPAVPSGSLTGFHVPSFSRNLVGVRPLVSQHVGVWIEPSGETAVCVDGDMYAPLATFTAEPGSGLYTLHTSPRGQQQQQLLPPTPLTIPCQVPASHQVAASPQVAVSGQVPVSGPVAVSCSYRLLAHPTVLWHHRMGHPSISCLHAMSSQRLVLGLPRVLPSLPPSLVPPCSPCVEGRLRATPHSSSLRPDTEPFRTLHLDVWGPTSRPDPEQESFFLVVVDDYSCYTTVFPLAKKSNVTSTLIRWLLTTADTRGRRVSCLHSDCGGLVMEIARTSMTHARAPHFLWPYAVRYAAHQLNLWPRVSRPKVSPTSLWTGTRLTTPFTTLPFTDSLTLVTSVSTSPSPTTSGVSHATPPPSVAPQVQPPSPQSSSQPTADPAGAGFRGKDPGGASSRGAGVGAESVPVRSPSSGGAGVGAEPVTAGDSSLRGAGVSGAVPGGATTGGAPSAEPGEPGTDPVTFGGPGSRGGATGSLESSPGATTAPDTTPPPHPYPTRNQARVRRAREEQLQLEREERELERQHLELKRLEEQQQQQPEQEQPQQQQQHQQQPPPPPVSGLRTLGLPSPSPPSPSSPLVSGPPLPPPDPSPTVFPPPLPPLSPPLSHTWPLRRSPQARPSSPVPFTDLRTALFCSSPPRLSPSVFPSPSESALTSSLSIPITDYYRTYRLVLSRVLASLITDPRASLSSVSTLTAAVTEFASTRCLDYATSLVAAPPTSPLAIGGESALGCDALEDRQFELEFLATASPHLCAMLLALEGDPDALDIPTPRTYAEAGEAATRISSGLQGALCGQRFQSARGSLLLSDLRAYPKDDHSTVQRTPLAVDHRLTGPFPDEPSEPSGPYAEQVGCLIYLMTCTRPDLAFPLSILACFVAQGRHRPVRWTAAMRVAKYLATTSGVGLVLGGRQDVVLTGHCDSSYADDAETHKSTQGYCFSLGSGAVSWRSTRSSSVLTSIAEAEIYAGAMAAQELHWLTFLLTDLSERPSSAPTLFMRSLPCRAPRAYLTCAPCACPAIAALTRAIAAPVAAAPAVAAQAVAAHTVAAPAVAAPAVAAPATAAPAVAAPTVTAPAIAAPAVKAPAVAAPAIAAPNAAVPAIAAPTCDSKDEVSLFDHTSGVADAPAADADSTVRSQWTTCDAAARLAVRGHLPSAERAHFS